MIRITIAIKTIMEMVMVFTWKPFTNWLWRTKWWKNLNTMVM